MKIQSIFVFTHDSIGLGEDGPTHQAVEQIPTLRMIPHGRLASVRPSRPAIGVAPRSRRPMGRPA